MDIQKFQQKLTEVCELGEKNGKVLKPEQIKECFGELDLDKSQLIKILQYLKLKGISIEGAEEISAASQLSLIHIFNLANFMRTNLYTCLGAMRVGLNLLFEKENVKVDRLLGLYQGNTCLPL